MKLSCLPVSLFQAIAVERTMPLADYLRLAKAVGLDGTECSLGFLRPLGMHEPSEFGAMVRDAGLETSMLTCHPDFTHPDPEARRAQVADMTRNLDVALTIGAPLIRVLSGQRHPGVSDEDGIGYAIDGLAALSREADARGLTLALENHTKSFFWQHFDFAQRGAVFTRIIAGLRGTSVRVNFDSANPIVAGEETLDLFEKVRDMVAILHVADTPTRGEFRFCRIGEGIAPIGEMFRRARLHGFDGWVSIEEASRSGLDAFGVAAANVRRLWAAAQPTT